MAKFLFLAKILFKKQAVSKQAARWTPLLIQQKLQNDSFKAYIFGLIGVPSFYQINNEYLKSMKYRNIYQFPRTEVTNGLSGLQNESMYTPQTGRQGDFQQIKNVQFVHAVQIVNNPMQMDEFSLDDVESVVSDFDYDEEFNNSNNSNLSESLVLSWNSSTAFESSSNVNSSNSNNVKFAF